MALDYNFLVQYVCGIHCENSKNNGTGFVVKKEDNLFLVTADHVVNNEDIKNTSILINRHGLIMSVASPYFSDNKFIIHNEADIAVLPLKADSCFINSIRPCLFNQLQDPQEGTEFSFLGFSNINTLNGQFRPKPYKVQDFTNIRHCRADNVSQEQDFLLLEVLSAAGDSGGAVFFGEEPLIAGIIHGGDSSKQKTVATPIKYLKEMLLEI